MAQEYILPWKESGNALVLEVKDLLLKIEDGALVVSSKHDSQNVKFYMDDEHIDKDWQAMLLGDALVEAIDYRAWASALSDHKARMRVER